MLEDIGKLPLIKKTIQRGFSLVGFIYSHSSILSLLRQFTNKRELVRYVITSVATEIATGRRTKIIICKKRVWSHHHSYYRKLWKTKNKKARSAKNQNLGPGVGYAWGRY